MARLGAAILLAVLLLPLPAYADIWRCHQPDGADLYTDSNQHPATCKLYVPQVELSYAPRSVSSTPLSVVPSEPTPLETPPALPETRREDTKPYTTVEDEQNPYDSMYPYSYPGGYWFPLILGSPRLHHGHHHHGQSSSHRSVAHSSSHGGGHGGHR